MPQLQPFEMSFWSISIIHQSWALYSYVENPSLSTGLWTALRTFVICNYIKIMQNYRA